jgi:hypothetical protein
MNENDQVFIQKEFSFHLGQFSPSVQYGASNIHILYHDVTGLDMGEG